MKGISSAIQVVSNHKDLDLSNLVDTEVLSIDLQTTRAIKILMSFNVEIYICNAFSHMQNIVLCVVDCTSKIMYLVHE